MDNRQIYEDYLMHHGIRGQKWGVRRFQNKDGSTTAAGRKRYSTDNANRSSSNSGNNSGSKKSGMSKGKKIAIGVGAVGAAAGIAFAARYAAKSYSTTRQRSSDDIRRISGEIDKHKADLVRMQDELRRIRSQMS